MGEFFWIIWIQSRAAYKREAEGDLTSEEPGMRRQKQEVRVIGWLWTRR